MQTRNSSKWNVIGPLAIVALALSLGVLPVCLGVGLLPTSFGVGTSPVCEVTNLFKIIGPLL